MKKCICIILVFFIASLSILAYCPLGIYAADNDFTTSTSTGCKLSYDEACKAINNRGDIYTSEHELFLMYTPTEYYNWSTSNNRVHLSDVQARTLLMSNNKFNEIMCLCASDIANSGITRALLSAAGAVFTHDSDTFIDAFNLLTGNVNYLNAIDYNEETQTITVNNDSGSVDKLRQEIYEMYCDSIEIYNSPLRNESPTKVVENNSSLYEYDEDYMFDFNEVAGYDYAYEVRKYDSGFSYKGAVVWNRSDYDYVYQSNVSGEGICFTDKDLNVIDDPFKHYYEEFNERYNDGYFGEIESLYIITTESANTYHNGLRCDLYFRNSLGELRPSNLYGGYIENVGNYESSTYSKKYKSFPVFRSYEALYNYVHGSQTAYLTSQINEIGQDISLSIKDMDENIGSKLDTLIDSINNNKGGISAEELQNAIDSGVDDILNNTEEIKDNTEDIVNNTGNILDTLKKQNAILLDILGVTSYIAYQNNEDKENSFTMSDMSDMLHKSFTSVIAAVMYGKMADDATDNTDASYKDGIFGCFPFSVPYQLYEWLKVLQAEPKCPEFTYNYGFLIGVDKNEEDYENYNITFDLSDFESWRNVLSSFLKLSFTLALAIGIYKKFKGDV